MVLNPGPRMELPGGAFKEICILDPSPGSLALLPWAGAGEIGVFFKAPR